MKKKPSEKKSFKPMSPRGISPTAMDVLPSTKKIRKVKKPKKV